MKALGIVLVALLLSIAGCTASGDPGGGSSDVTVSATVGFETVCEAEDCSVTATLTASDGTDDAVRLHAYESEDRTVGERLYTFTDPGSSVGESVVLTVPARTEIAVVLERSDGEELTQIHYVSAPGATPSPGRVTGGVSVLD